MKELDAETVAAIVEAVASGVSERAAAERYGVSKTTAHRYARMAGVNRPRNGNARRQAPCRSCGVTCWSIRALCRQCWQKPASIRADESAALTGGEWVPNGRGVMVWQPELEEAS